jgi:hypothetical protein
LKSDSGCDTLVVADLMEEKGWKMERQQNPSCIHFSIMPTHEQIVDTLIEDLKEVGCPDSSSLYSQVT